MCGDHEWETAHILGRDHDPPLPGFWSETMAEFGWSERYDRWVDPDGVVPLCPMHHRAYDEHRLNLRSHLLSGESEYVERHGRASWRRVTGRDGLSGSVTL